MQRIVRAADLFTAGAVTWGLAIPGAAMLAAAPGPATARPLISTLVYLAGAVVCHQRPERSFHLAGHALPVCARCTGIYEAAAATALLLWLASRATSAGRAPAPARSQQVHVNRLLFVAALLPTAATLFWEWAIGSTPSNVIRACAGLPAGAVVAWIVMRSVRAEAQSG